MVLRPDCFRFPVFFFLLIVLAAVGFAHTEARSDEQPTRQPFIPNHHSSVTRRKNSSRSLSEEELRAGQEVFVAQCGFCHGRNARGGQSGPDLVHSELLARDINGEKIGPVIRNGRLDKGMPAFGLRQDELAGIVAFLHELRTKTRQRSTSAAIADAKKEKEGGRRSVDLADLKTGDPEAGKQYFNGAGGCTECHSPTGDLAGVASRFQGLELLQRMLYPVRRGARARTARFATATVTLPTGETVSGKLAYQDEFSIAVVDSSGWYRSWPSSQVKFTVVDPLESHSKQLGRYTDEDMHNLLAYLQTLR